jgi:hypothetical protein
VTARQGWHAPRGLPGTAVTLQPPTRWPFPGFRTQFVTLLDPPDIRGLNRFSRTRCMPYPFRAGCSDNVSKGDRNEIEARFFHETCRAGWPDRGQRHSGGVGLRGVGRQRGRQAALRGAPAATRRCLMRRQAGCTSGRTEGKACADRRTGSGVEHLHRIRPARTAPPRHGPQGDA